MDAVIVPVLSKSRIDFSFLGASASETVQLVRSINVAPFYRVQLIVRIHSLTLDPSTPGSFAFDLVNTLPSDDDPREFSASGTPFISIPVNSSSPAAPVIVSGTATDPGAYLKLSLTATQGGAGVNFYGEFSAVLLGRSQ